MALLAYALTPAPAIAQFGCTEPTSNEWLRQPARVELPTELGEDRVFQVTQQMSEAIGQLQQSAALPLTDSEAQKFTGKPVTGDRGLRAYLVRAVYPSTTALLHVRWDGRRLYVFAGGLGCAPYIKHPIVVLLERKPREVYVMASAVL